MTSESIDSWSDIFGTVAAWLALLTAIAGALAWRFATWSADANKAELKKFQTESKVEIAQSNARACAATLQLERLKRDVSPRHISSDKFLQALSGQSKATVEIMYLRDDPECFDVAQQIWGLLQMAKWDVSPPKAIPATNTSLGSDDPLPMSVGGQPSGITVVAHSATEKETKLTSDMLEGGSNWEKTPWNVLKNAFLKSLGKVSASAGGIHAPPDGTLRIVIAPRTGAP